MEHVLIIGGGGTGGALAHDLVLRGYRVSLFEKGELLSGTTGRHHGLLHSGARYAVHDPNAARECIQENELLKRLAPDAIEPNDGLFVALDDEDLDYRRAFLAGCAASGIPADEINPDKALSMEPGLNPAIKSAIRVPDATMDAWRLPMHFFATARANGAKINPFTEVTAILSRGGSVSGIRVFDLRTHRESDIQGDLVINCAGPWAGKIAALAGQALPIQPSPGVMVAVGSRLNNMVINRLHPAGEGDIIVPQRRLSILGTSAWLVEDPDSIEMRREQVEQIIKLCAEMLPAVSDQPIHSTWSAARPLIGDNQSKRPMAISRDFNCFDHGKIGNLEGMISIIGGKATTLRAMAEETADMICRKTGRDIPCQTRETPLLHYRSYFKLPHAKAPSR